MESQRHEQGETLSIQNVAVSHRRRLLRDIDLPGGRPAAGYGHGESPLGETQETLVPGIQEAGDPTLLDPEYRAGDERSLAYPSGHHQNGGDGADSGGCMAARWSIYHPDQEEQVLQRGSCGAGSVSDEKQTYPGEEGRWNRGESQDPGIQLQHIPEHAPSGTAKKETCALAEGCETQKRILHCPDPRRHQPQNRI